MAADSLSTVVTPGMLAYSAGLGKSFHRLTQMVGKTASRIGAVAESAAHIVQKGKKQSDAKPKTKAVPSGADSSEDGSGDRLDAALVKADQLSKKMTAFQAKANALAKSDAFGGRFQRIGQMAGKTAGGLGLLVANTSTFTQGARQEVQGIVASFNQIRDSSATLTAISGELGGAFGGVFDEIQAKAMAFADDSGLSDFYQGVSQTMRQTVGTVRTYMDATAPLIHGVKEQAAGLKKLAAAYGINGESLRKWGTHLKQTWTKTQGISGFIGNLKQQFAAMGGLAAIDFGKTLAGMQAMTGQARSLFSTIEQEANGIAASTVVDDRFKAMAKVIANSAGVIGAGLDFTSQIISTGQQLHGLWTVFSQGAMASRILTVLKVSMAQFNVVMAANPFGMIAATVGILIGAGVALYMNWETVVAWFSDKLTWFKTAFPATFDELSSVVGWFSEKITWLKTVFFEAFDVMKTLFGWTPLGLVINNWGAIIGFFSGLWQHITGIFDRGLAKVRAIWQTISEWTNKLAFWRGADDNVVKVRVTEGIVQDKTGVVSRLRQQPDPLTYPSRQQPRHSRAMTAIHSTTAVGKTPVVHQQVGEINVYAAPGQSSQDVAKAVHRQLGGRQNSALYDLPEAG